MKKSLVIFAILICNNVFSQASTYTLRSGDSSWPMTTRVLGSPAIRDTVAVILLVSDTLENNTHFTMRTAYWVYGYSVRKYVLTTVTDGWKYYSHLYYIDDHRKRFPKNIVIWSDRYLKDED